MIDFLSPTDLAVSTHLSLSLSASLSRDPDVLGEGQKRDEMDFRWINRYR